MSVSRSVRLALLGAALALPLASAQDPGVEIYGLRHHVHANFTRIVIDIGRLREYTAGELRGPDRIFADILEAKLNPILHGQDLRVAADYISSIRIAQKTPGTVRLVVDVDFRRIESHRVYHLFDPFRIVVDIYPKSGAAAGGGLPPEPRDAAKPPAAEKAGTEPEIPLQPAQPTAAGYTLARQLGLGARTIVIDPGHGGRDPGCIGKAGLREKDVVLDLSLRLKKLIEAKTDLAVVLTRESDIFVELTDRPTIAQQKAADLFVSIHLNANPSRKKTGVQTFFLNVNPDQAVMEVAARENATSTKTLNAMGEIYKKLVLNDKIIESRELAGRVQASLVKALGRSFTGIKNLGVKGGPFWVLIGTTMPSILVEATYLSNAADESRLKTDAYRQAVAQGVFEGIMDYIHSLGKG
ncbi:MAG: N-acetylmuramoyl-L-alanine amidase [Candidatus Aminicenantes bacterium]|nr:N-acetylmuramoyl-L-alanine amidase [Candidatus Aminicenantes bacterium]